MDEPHEGDSPQQGKIAPTDRGWYEFLRNQPGLDEVNFWTPSAEREFRAERFSPFFFELKSPHNAICGFGWLFDQGYVTVTPEGRFEVGRRLREEFDNGRSYYPLHGAMVRAPASQAERPDPSWLRWHNEHRYLG